ncbi:Hypothetical predicted protein [Octopus vulgaris]|uniref:Uncharacterized protein n=1 Tax=Octopus vulgaris TaxID=6645 RepID=A0AA36API4_OCTVU|nr:Hypothetical predicted protein [Octopus vulgaris]
MNGKQMLGASSFALHLTHLSFDVKTVPFHASMSYSLFPLAFTYNIHIATGATLPVRYNTKSPSTNEKDQVAPASTMADAGAKKKFQQYNGEYLKYSFIPSPHTTAWIFFVV